jgi:pyrroloquinoline quinone biosynthesis protein D
MEIPGAARPIKKDGVHTQKLPDGSTLLFDQESEKALAISQSAALIWEICDGEHSVDQLIEHLLATYDAPRETISADVRACIRELANVELVKLGANDE